MLKWLPRTLHNALRASLERGEQEAYSCKKAADEHYRTSRFNSIGQETSTNHREESDHIRWNSKQLGGDIGVSICLDDSWKEMRKRV